MDKVDVAQRVLESFQPQEGYILAYSGGKDSDVIRRLAELAKIKYRPVHNLTTVDAPETVYHVREQIGEENIDKPERSMWQLIVDNKYPPTRIARYCCRELKEKSNVGRVTITGVRKAEGTSRKANQGLITFPQKDDVSEIAESMNVDFISTDKGGVVLNNDDSESRRLVENCYRTHKTLVNPIIDWSDADVWGFIKHHGIKVNPLYAEGACRVGCIGCPMAGKARWFQFYRYPKYRGNFIRAFDRMIKRRIETGLNPVWKDGEECFRWWMEDRNLDGQITLDDI